MAVPSSNNLPARAPEDEETANSTIPINPINEEDSDANTASTTSSRPDTPTAASLSSPLPFPPLYKSHILNCAFASWYNRYRAHIPKTRVIPLTKAFLSYLRSDGIFLPPSDNDTAAWSDSDSDNDHDSGIYSVTDDDDGGNDADSDDDGGESTDPTLAFPHLHATIQETIASLGGAVFPKLNWSAPKDATWISATNTLECRNPSDVYLLLKSSDFITHDLEHVFDGCIDAAAGPGEEKEKELQEIEYTLVLRKFFTMNPSAEFRCFVQDRRLVAISQRDLNHYDFLAAMVPELTDLIVAFFEEKLKATFPDPNFTFDVYIPRTQSKVWLIDINPWAQRTDPILYSWLEILRMDPEMIGLPELRIIKKDDPEAYCFNSPQYSAHKLPKEVVDAGLGGAASIQEFAQRWRDIVNNMPD